MMDHNHRDRVSRTAGIVLAAALAAPAGAWAASPGYDYVEGYYALESGLSGPGVGLDGDGFGAIGSMSLTESVFVRGWYDEVEHTEGPDSADTKTWQVGVGVHHAVGESVDVFGVLGYEDLDLVEVADGDGPAVEVGLRWQATPQVEFNTFARFVDYGELDAGGGTDAEADGRFYGFGIAYDLAPGLAITADYRDGDYELSAGGMSADLGRDDVRVGVRWNFDGPFVQ